MGRASQNATSFGALLINGDEITASETLNRGRSGRIQVLGNASGLTVTLPTPTGSGAVYKFAVSTDLTTNDYIIACPSGVTFEGVITVVGASTTGFIAAAGNNTITLNGGTSGGDKGTVITIIDRSSTVFVVEGVSAGAGVVVTPFSTV